MTTKINIEPQVEASIKEKNDILKNILATQTYTDSYGKLRFKKNTNFFSYLNNVRQIQNVPVIFSEKNFINNKKPAPSDIEKIACTLSKKGVRGNLLIRLAVDWLPFSIINLENGSLWHVGIFTGVPKNVCCEDDTISIAAQIYDSKGNKLRKILYENITENGVLLTVILWR